MALFASIKKIAILLAGLLTVSAELITLVYAQEPEITSLRETIEFGVISGKEGICRMNRRGRLLGLAGQDCVGRGQTARYRIIGERFAVVNIQALGSDQGPVSFRPVVAGSSTRVLRGRNRNVVIAGDLTISGRASGSYSLNYIININYE